MVYMCMSLNTPLGTLPTNTSYWYPLSIKGERGEAGLGLSFCGYWSSTVAYSKDSAVTYNNSLYASLIDNNTSHTPATNSSYWSEIINFNTITTYNNATSGTTATTMQGAIDELYSKTKTNATSISTNTSSINTINTKLTTIENGAQKNTVTGIKGDSESSYRTGNINITKTNIGLGNCDNTADSTKSVKYATSAGSATTSGTCTGNSATATYANSAGNCDTIDGYHITVSTTDLTAGTSALTTNTFCFVYE